jgi:hypothetical protein
MRKRTHECTFSGKTHLKHLKFLKEGTLDRKNNNSGVWTLALTQSSKPWHARQRHPLINTEQDPNLGVVCVAPLHVKVLRASSGLQTP